MKVSFNISPLNVGGFVELIHAAVLNGANGPFERSERLEEGFTEETLRAAITAWAAGEDYPRLNWAETDTSFPIDNWVNIKGHRLGVGVYTSVTGVERNADGTFTLEAGGTRHSFGVNITGDVARACLRACHGKVTDIKVESQASQPWDNELTNLFQETRVARLRRELGRALDGIRSPKVMQAAAALLAALQDPIAGQEHNEALVEPDEFVEVQEL